MEKHTTKAYDVVVIGAGNGGLTAAIRVLQGGYSCLLLEKHNLPGGFATSFKRGRFEFEASLHELNDFGSAEEPGDIRTLFRSLGVEDKIDWVRIPEAYHLITTDKKYDCVMPFGIQAFIDKMEEYCPGSRKSMTEFFELCNEVRDAQTYSNSVNGNTDSEYMKKNFPNFIKAGSYSVNQVLDALKMPEKAKDILNAYWCYLGVDCDRMSFLHYGSMVIRYITRDAWMPKMRSHEISLAMDARIRELGGDIWYNTEVAKIDVKDNKVQGVTLKDGTHIACERVVSNLMPTVVFSKMVDPAEVPERDRRACNARKLAQNCFTIYLGLDATADELGIEGYDTFVRDTGDTLRQYETSASIDTHKTYCVTCLNRAIPDCSPPGTCILSFSKFYSADAFAGVSEREYFELKTKIAEETIDHFEKWFKVDIRSHIEEIVTASPVTFARYIGTPQGDVYGYASEMWDGMFPRVMSCEKLDYTIKGLRFCGGHGTNMDGYSQAYLSGAEAARYTLKDMKEGR